MKIDVAIIGGGIAGLWCLNRLRAAGYDAHLFEKNALGAGQTIACQGILHNGAKYAADSPIRIPLQQMQNRWMDCLSGHGEIDLSGVQINGSSVNYFSPGCVDNFGENILDVKSVLTVLRQKTLNHVHMGEPVPARLTLITGGLGNEQYSKHTQRRPLKMFMMKSAPGLHFAHYMEKRGEPSALTITTHYFGEEFVWLLGGGIAERSENTIVEAKRALEKILPQSNFDGKEWASFAIDRAEPLSKDNVMPNEPVLEVNSGIAVAWPIKLVLAPMLSDQVLEWVKQIDPSEKSTQISGQTPEIASYPWEHAEWSVL